MLRTTTVNRCSKFCYNTIMEYKIETRSAKTRKFLTAIMPSIVRQLALSKSRKVVVIRVERTGKENSGYTVNIDELGAYMVIVKPGTLAEMGVTLAHEMVHVQQMAKGLLRPQSNGVNIWRGKRYTKKTKYLESPWELGAFAKQEIIFRKALEE